MSVKNKILSIFLAIFTLVFLANFNLANAGEVENVELEQHEAKVIYLPQNMTHVIIANRKVAGLVKHSAKKVSVIGHDIGKTDVRIMNGKRIVTQLNVTVGPDLTSIKKSLVELFPAETIGLTIANESVVMTGLVADDTVAKQAKEVVSQFLPKANIVNLLKLRSGQQVMLHVRVGELKRVAFSKLGLGVQGILSAGTGVIGLLEQQQVFKTLAEPSLTAISGQSAEFLAGGEFPVPVSSNGDVSVNYKKFGVSVDFTPTVINQHRVRVDMSSEISELSDLGAVNLDNLSIPAVTTRRANTTVELAPGESFMIAGLIRNDFSLSLNDVPGLARIPILNALFRSQDFRRNESELVIIVTPYVVDPMEAKYAKLPVDNLNPPSQFEMMFLGSLGEFKTGDANSADSLKFEGPVGFMLD